MKSNKKKARIAGLLYLVVVITGFFSLAYVPSKLIFWDNPTATFNAIKASETLFRFGIVSGIVCYIFFLLLPVALYKLLAPVNDLYAKLMVLLAIISVPVSFLNIQNKFSVLSLINNENHTVFTNKQLKSQVMFYLNQYDNGILMVSIFWGLWLFPFGYLVYKSGFLPKIFGVLLIMGCFGYLINFFGNTLIPNYADFGVSKYISIPSALGEIGICLWLLIIGAKEKSTL
ncbi:DUF4386 domain-containing protein [Flavobacterium saccharophilum]|uniref:DUF4386 domain-containing protein n=1 Tax=Flavobacterium saccharophilum TaxID=29534 RepID=A0A1M7D9D5_9FLAO|nr:DUF4386 domain-containing protein [Flavobacterium saccharophilum]SHL76131.1 protein of unknown function [Flavobacterium saccharophilum]